MNCVICVMLFINVTLFLIYIQLKMYRDMYKDSNERKILY